MIIHIWGDMGIQWEYKVEIFLVGEASKFTTDLENWLNKLGADGWNLVTVDKGGFIFKRSKR